MASPVSTNTETQVELNYFCPHCKVDVEKILNCSRCYFEQYCTIECQNKRWPVHRAVCKMINTQSEEWKKNNPIQSPSPFWNTATEDRVSQILGDHFDVQRADAPVAIDLGCGDGASTLFLLERGWKVIAIDYFDGPLSRLEQKANQINREWLSTKQLVIEKSDITKYSFLEEVDMIIALDLFPYITPLKLGELWRKIHLALNDKGHFLGSFFDKNHTCQKVYGAWVVNGLDSVDTILSSSNFYSNWRKRYRIKDGGSRTIDFWAIK